MHVIHPTNIRKPLQAVYVMLIWKHAHEQLSLLQITFINTLQNFNFSITNAHLVLLLLGCIHVQQCIYPVGENTFSMKPEAQAGILFKVNSAQIAKLILFVSVQLEKLCAKTLLTIYCCAILYNQFSIQL